MKYTESLKKNHEFRRIYAKAKSAATPLLVVYARKNRFGSNRLGITVTTKLGNAVHRNRVRRRIKEIYRLGEHRLVTGLDIVIVARVKADGAEYRELERSFFSCCKRLGVLR